MPEPVGAARHLVDLAAAGEPADVGAYMRALEPAEAGAVEAWARHHLAGLPPAIARDPDSAVSRRRRALLGLRAEAAARRGEPTALLDVLRDDWLVRREDALPFLRLAVEVLGWGPAGAWARCVLQGAGDDERVGVEAFLAEAGSPTDPWSEAVREYVARPSQKRWDTLVAAGPPDVTDDRPPLDLRLLLRLGVRPERLFAHAARKAAAPDLVELVASGGVGPEAPRKRAARAKPRQAAPWLALAALAAGASGDRAAAAALVAEAREACPDPAVLYPLIAAARLHADPALTELVEEAVE